MYQGDFNSVDDVVAEFQITPQDLARVTMAYASYEFEHYEGAAFVLFVKDDKLYEVHASHCSCYGLEGQWEPEETSVDELLFRLKNGAIYGADTKTLLEMIEFYKECGLYGLKAMNM